MAGTLRYILKPAIITLLSLCAFLTPSFALEPVIIDDKLQNIPIGRHLEYLEDRSSALTLRDIVSGCGRDTGRWTPSKEDKLGFGFSPSVYWVRFTAKNPSRVTVEYYVKQEYPLINNLTFFYPDERGRYQEVKTGNLYPFAHRPVTDRSFIFPQTIEAGREKTYYLRYQTQTSINIDLSALSLRDFRKIKDSEIIFYSLFVGIFLAMFIYNLIIFFAGRDWSHFFYIMYIASFGLFTLSMSGLARQYLWPDNIWLGSFSTPISMSGAILFFVPFMISYNDMRQYSETWDRVLKAYIVVVAVFFLLIVLAFDYRTSINIATALSGFSAILGTIWSIHFVFVKKSRPALIFSFALIIFFAGVIMKVLQLAGAISATMLTSNCVYVGSIFQIIILSFGFVDRINIMRNELRALNTGLELKVLERVAELQSANEEIEAMNENLLETRDALWGEMQLARKIQTVLLPDKPAIDGYEISAFMRPASDVGGDYYDIISAGGMDWVIIGDVSGHGVSAGLVMMMAQTAINTIIENEPHISPSDVLIKANKTIYQNIQKLNEDKYITITILAAHRDGRFVFSGLHQDIMIYRKKSNEVEIVETDGMWIGIMDELKDIPDNEFEINPGDVVLLYTDGITEAWEHGSVRDIRNPDTQLFGDERLRSVFRNAAERPTDEIKNSIIVALDDYDCLDDVTMVIIRKK